MKIWISRLGSCCLLLMLCGCTEQVSIKRTFDESWITYYEMSDGTWQCNDISYEYRLEIKGRLNNAACDTVYVYLSNRPEISFEEAWKASGLSSNMADYFDPEVAVLVEMEIETETE